MKNLLFLFLLPLFSFGQSVVSPTNPFTGDYYNMVIRAGINYTGSHTVPIQITASFVASGVSVISFQVVPTDATFDMGDGNSASAVEGTLSYSYAEEGTYTITTTAALTQLDCSTNSLTSLNVSGLTALVRLFCSGNLITSLNVSGLTALTYLDCSTNSLTSLNVSGLTALTGLYCSVNSLTSLNVSGCTALTYLDCSTNSLTSLNVSGLTALTGLYCSFNLLTESEITNLITGMVDRTDISAGAYVIAHQADGYPQTLIQEQTDALTAKNWGAD
jgi:hypothetical protein